MKMNIADCVGYIPYCPADFKPIRWQLEFNGNYTKTGVEVKQVSKSRPLGQIHPGMELITTGRYSQNNVKATILAKSPWDIFKNL